MYSDLLATILERPTDLAARRVYADALQEAGDPRGAFISFQLEGRPEADALLRTHRKAWTAFLHDSVGQGYRFRNGFVERVTLRPGHAPALPVLLAQTPLTEVRLRDINLIEAKVFAGLSACTRRLTWLDLKQGHATATVFTVLMQAAWTHLVRLRAPSNPIGNEGAAALVSTELPSLLHLDLHGARLGDAIIDRLMRWSRLRHLETLNLRGNHLSDDAVAQLCRQLTGVRQLGLELAGPRTAAALSSHALIEHLHVSRADTSTAAVLSERFGASLRLDPGYDSVFEVPWP